MVERYLNTQPDAEKFIIDECLPRMIREYEFWMKKRSMQVRIATKKWSRLCRLNLYKVNTNRPRPESYYEDLTTGKYNSYIHSILIRTY